MFHTWPSRKIKPIPDRDRNRIGNDDEAHDFYPSWVFCMSTNISNVATKMEERSASDKHDFEAKTERQEAQLTGPQSTTAAFHHVHTRQLWDALDAFPTPEVQKGLSAMQAEKT
jgi:hypothetical protein